jgi:hypothetical protein
MLRNNQYTLLIPLNGDKDLKSSALVWLAETNIDTKVFMAESLIRNT